MTAVPPLASVASASIVGPLGLLDGGEHLVRRGRCRARAPSSSTMTPRPDWRGQRGVEGGAQRARARGPRCRRGAASRGRRSRSSRCGSTQPSGWRSSSTTSTQPSRRPARPASAVAPSATVGSVRERQRRGRRRSRARGSRGRGRRSRRRSRRPGAASSSAGVGELGELAADAQHRDLVAELDRLVDVVGDEHDGLAQLALQAQELVLQLLAHDRVDGAERLVHQHHRRVGGQRPGDADALLLAAGQLGRVALGERRVAGRPARAAPSPAARAFALSLAEQQRHGRDVVDDGAVREEARRAG